MRVDRDPLALEAWDQSSDLERRGHAAAVADAVGGRVIDVEIDCQGDQRHTVAVIEVRGVSMVLVPGGTVTLGWDRSRPLALTPAQQVAVALDPASRAGFDQRMRSVLSPERSVTLSPFLLEVEPHSIESWLPTLDGGDRLAAIETRVVSDGFRLATDDEWEHAVHGGSTSLFRWGDQWPDGHPVPRETHFTGHLVPTAFGLHLLADPHQLEIVSTPLGFRGGDGGSAVQSGLSDPEPWITFASAFTWPAERWAENVAGCLRQSWVRRALSIP